MTDIINTIFSWTDYAFMKNALIAVILITPVFGLLGSMIVNNKMAFFSDALGHSTLTGAGIGVLLGMAHPDIAMVIFGILFAIGIVIIKYTQKTSMDTTIGVFSSIAVALGIVLLTGTGFNKYSSIFVGDILSITSKELYMLLILLIIVLIVWKLFSKTLMLVSLSNSIAISRNINIMYVDMIFTALIAVVVTISIRWVGLLIINSLFVLPAATARIIAKDIKSYTIISVLNALFCGLFGLFTAYYMGTSPSATISLYCGALYFIVFIFRRKA